MHLLTLGRCLRGPRQQIDDLVLRTMRLTGGEPEDLSHRVSTCVVQVRARTNSCERLDDSLPRIVQVSIRDLSLPRQNLPNPDTRLKSTEGVAANRHRHVVQRLCHFNKSGDRRVAESWELRKNSILIAELFEFACQQADCRWREAMIEGSPAIQLADRHIDLQRSHSVGARDSPNIAWISSSGRFSAFVCLAHLRTKPEL